MLTPSAPTLDAAALELLRVSGQRVPVVDASTARAVEVSCPPDGYDVAVM